MPDVLKPCPFCGGEGLSEKTLRLRAPEWQGDQDAYAYFIRCRSCAGQGGWSKNAAGAVRQWNMRSQEDRLRAALQQYANEENWDVATTFGSQSPFGRSSSWGGPGDGPDLARRVLKGD